MQWPSGYGLASYHFFQDGDSEEMVTTVGCSSTGFPSAVNDIADTFFAAWVSELAGVFSVDITLDHVDVSAGPSSAPINGTSSISPTAGTNSSGITLPNTALLVRKITATGGRKGRGRMYWPGFGGVNNLTSAGTIVGGAMSTYQSQFDDWQTALETSSGPGAIGFLYLFHDDATPPSLITAFQLQQKMATQRRRLRP